jgi:hypothetical protein
VRLGILLAFCGLCSGLAAEPTRPPVLAHVMTWFEAERAGAGLGWHWTMGRRDLPAGALAAHDAPLIGPYDSADRWVAEYQVLTMKLAGIDGAIIDWYGPDGFEDYAANHRGTCALIAECKRAGLRFAICFEDRAWRRRQEARRLSRAQTLAEGRAAIDLLNVWLSDEAALRVDGKPALLLFGPMWMEGGEARDFRAALRPGTLVYALPHLAPAAGFADRFAWLPVAEGRRPDQATWTRELLAAQVGGAAAVAFPGYHDYYAEAGQGPSYGFIPRETARTMQASLDLALARPAPFIQLATWNDYGEGTAIEPSRREGFTALEAVQRRLRPGLGGAALLLPERLLALRRRHPVEAQPAILGRIAALLVAGDTAEAARLLETAR